MEKKIKTTKESLLKDNARLNSKLDSWIVEDAERRKVLSELLDSYEYVSNEYGYSNNSKKRQILVRDWLGIAFLIGELKADADYAMCIEARELLRNENNTLKQEIYNLKNPPLTP